MSEETCNHKYQVLDSSVDRLYADSSMHKVEVDILFYCEKCTDVVWITREMTNDDKHQTT